MRPNLKFSLLLVVITLGNLSAQIPQVEWYKTFGRINASEIYDGAIGPNDEMVTVGHFQDSLDLDPDSTNTAMLYALPGQYKGYAVKVSSKGVYKWSYGIGCNTTDQATIREVAISASGDVYIAGAFFCDSLDVNPDPNSSNYLQKGVFIVKLDSLGNYVWGLSHGMNCNVTKLLVDSQGKLIVSGVYGSSFDMNPGPVYLPSAPPSGTRSSFIEKISASGQQNWIKLINGGAMALIDDMALLNGLHPVLVGSYSGSVDFNPNPGVFTFPNPSSSITRGFVLQLTQTGGFTRALGLQGAGTSEVFAIEVDANQDLLFAGAYQGTVDFDPTGSVVTNTASNAGWFFAKMSVLGQLQWVKPYANTIPSNIEYNRPLDIALDSQGAIYLAGQYIGGSMGLEPGNPSALVLTRNGSAAYRNAFALRYSNSGNLEWAHSFLADNGASSIRKVFINRNDRLLLTGQGNRIRHDPYNLSIPGVSDLGFFHIKFENCPKPLDSVTTEWFNCARYFEPITQQVFKSDTLLKLDTLQNIKGCDSVYFSVDIRVYRLEGIPLNKTSTGSLTWSGSSSRINDFFYNWYDCDKDSLIYPNAGFEFFAPYSGNFALMAEHKISGCIDTSACHSLQYTTVLENPLHTLTLYPNPTHGQLTIGHNPEETYHLTLMDLSGKKLLERSQQNQLDISAYPKGTYLLRIQKDEWQVVRKVLRE